MSAALASRQRSAVQDRIKVITNLILNEERAITAALRAIEFLSAERRELTDSLVDDSQLITQIIDIPMLRGGNHLNVSEAERIIRRLTEYVEQNGSGV